VGGQRIYGASIGAYNLLAQEFNYTLIYVEECLDVFLIHNDEIRGADGRLLPVNPLDAYASIAGVPFHLCCAPPDRVAMLWDYYVWRKTRNASAARKGAQRAIKLLNVSV
jgi:hypothetical protein